MRKREREREKKIISEYQACCELESKLLILDENRCK